MVNQIKRFIKEDEGATAIEYGLLAALIGAAIVTTVTTLGGTLDTTFSGLNSDISGS